LQTTGFTPTHDAPWQLSVWVQRLPSSHGVPLGFGGVEHSPVAGLHTPMVWHWPAVQATGSAPTHVPAMHESVCVHRLVSLHGLPFSFAGFEQVPVAGSQTPTA
jgi:hypothetical protein